MVENLVNTLFLITIKLVLRILKVLYSMQE
jgi:hypothetical protein